MPPVAILEEAGADDRNVVAAAATERTEESILLLFIMEQIRNGMPWACGTTDRLMGRLKDRELLPS